MSVKTDDSGSPFVETSLAKRETKPSRDQFLKSIEIKVADSISEAAASYTEEELGIVRRRLGNLRHGACAAIPIRCRGAGCPMKDSCPLYEIGKAPIGLPCPIEISLLNEWRSFYIAEYDVDPDSFTELSMVNELAEIELLQWRINNSLSKAENAMLISDNAVGVDRNGDVVTRREVSAFFDIREKLNNRKSRVVKLMVGDRQEKYKKQAATKTLSDTDPSSRAAELRASLTEVMKLAKQVQKDMAIDAEVLSPEDIIGGD